MIPAIRAIGERIIEEKSPLVTIKDVPVIANKIEMSSRPEGVYVLPNASVKLLNLFMGI